MESSPWPGAVSKRSRARLLRVSRRSERGPCAPGIRRSAEFLILVRSPDFCGELPSRGAACKISASRAGRLRQESWTRFEGVSPYLRKLRRAAAVWVHSAGKRNSRLSVGGNSFAGIGAPPARPASFLEFGFAAFRACSVRSFNFGSGNSLAGWSSPSSVSEIIRRNWLSNSALLFRRLPAPRIPVAGSSGRGVGGTEGEPRNLLPGSSPSRRLPGLRPWNFGKPAPRCLWPRGCRPRRAELSVAVPGLPSRELRISSLSRREALPAREPPRLKSGSLAAGS